MAKVCQVLSGKKIARSLLNQLKREIVKTAQKPGLAVVLVGENPASRLYVNLKEKAASAVGVYFQKHLLPEKINERFLLQLINRLDQQTNIHGIVVQLPLPKHLNTKKIISAIDPKKDADGFHIKNLSLLKKYQPSVLPVLVQVTTKLLETTGLNFYGKTACLLGNSATFFKPFQIYLPRRFGLKIITTHVNNSQLKSRTKKADVLITALGQAGFISSELVKKGAVVIDIGTSRQKNKIRGDVDFKKVCKKASFITPVPGGVGPLTVAYLLKNVHYLSKKTNYNFIQAS